MEVVEVVVWWRRSGGNGCACGEVVVVVEVEAEDGKGSLWVVRAWLWTWEDVTAEIGQDGCRSRG